MTRAVLTALFLLAALVIATPRPAQTDIPSASVHGWTQGDRETDHSARTGAPDAVVVNPAAEAENRPWVVRATQPSGPAGSPSPSTARTLAGPSSSLPGVAATLGASRKPATASKAPQRVRTPLKASTRPYVALHALTGAGTWYCGHGSPCTVGYGPGCYCAAAGPALRTAMGSDWRGQLVRVEAIEYRTSAQVRLIDCLCSAGLIDLYAVAWEGMGVPLSVGRIRVEVTW